MSEEKLPPEIEEALASEAGAMAVDIIDNITKNAKEAWEKKKSILVSKLTPEAKDVVLNSPVYEAIFISGYVSGVLDSGVF